MLSPKELRTEIIAAVAFSVDVHKAVEIRRDRRIEPDPQAGRGTAHAGGRKRPHPDRVERAECKRADRPVRPEPVGGICHRGKVKRGIDAISVPRLLSRSRRKSGRNISQVRHLLS